MLATLLLKATTFWAAAKAKIIIGGLILVGLGIASGFIYSMGAAGARAKCDVAALKSQIATLKKDMEIIRKSAGVDRASSEEIAALIKQNIERIDDYEKQIKDRPACRVVPDDLPRRVR